jgi:hypothetical protein
MRPFYYETISNSPFPGGMELEGGDFTPTLPHPNPLQRVEREFPSRERIFI